MSSKNAEVIDGSEQTTTDAEGESLTFFALDHNLLDVGGDLIECFQQTHSIEDFEDY